MKKFLAYLNYVIKHKYYVFVYGRQLKCNLWDLLWHDWTKFFPSEFIPYMNRFYLADGNPNLLGNLENEPSFLQAWNHHEKSQKHHWQYWVLIKDSGELIPLPMPEKYIREMVADWMGAGKMIQNQPNCSHWYNKNRDKMMIHSDSRKVVEQLLGRLQEKREL